MSHYSKQELLEMGFIHVGEHCMISKKASFYGCRYISLGNNVRIDDFCVLSAGSEGIWLGNFIHIAVFSSLIGSEKIVVSDYANISSRVSIYSSSDDYSGSYMTNPMVDGEYTNVLHAPVKVCEHVIIGSGSVVLPGVVLKQGAAVGALSLVNKSLSEFMIYAGQPVKEIKARKRDLLVCAEQFEKSWGTQ
ncbi:galactoside O-acetyltransferase [Pseudoalteromonas aurantia]|uniref:acyltransferase n=1 Tax=Pseudoalteromonas aurantia TaxID=43654 RepID=UPI00110A7819|nr:acyltransferase [Pseudoalteromonas aurantia]TMO67088.1 galactoside O-acetyltransferase [Pseudoalteromonas aurantia]